MDVNNIFSDGGRDILPKKVQIARTCLDGRSRPSDSFAMTALWPEVPHPRGHPGQERRAR
jgi:hypothetical protein